MFNVFSNLEYVITRELMRFALTPLSVIILGLTPIVASILTAWLIYRSYLVLAGFSSEPLMEILRDFFIKIFFLTIATSVALFVDMVYTPITESFETLGNELGGNNTKSIFNTLEAHFMAINVQLDSLITDTEPDSSALDEATRKNGGEPVHFGSWLWNTLKDKASAAADALDLDILYKKIMAFFIFIVMLAGLIIFGVFAFLSMITNKLFFMICLRFGPIFVFFAAFNHTRSYFQSWLSTTLGYGLSYALIMSCLNVIMEIFKSLFSTSGLSFFTATFNFIVCIIFSVIIVRIGDLSSAFFGAGNMSDGTIGSGAITARGIKNLLTRGNNGNNNKKPKSNTEIERS